MSSCYPKEVDSNLPLLSAINRQEKKNGKPKIYVHVTSIHTYRIIHIKLNSKKKVEWTTKQKIYTEFITRCSFLTERNPTYQAPRTNGRTNERTSGWKNEKMRNSDRVQKENINSSAQLSKSRSLIKIQKMFKTC